MKILVLTGAGISAESGIPTFRGGDGLWEGYRFEDVATPEAFRDNPALVHEFYNQRRRKLHDPALEPNAAHLALADFERQHDDDFLLVTQNIDNLHQRAGSQAVLPMHGELLKARCQRTGEIFDWPGDLAETSPHPKHPKLTGQLRPHVVWFGEVPLGMEQIVEFASRAELFLAIGTSAVVSPASGIVSCTPQTCRCVEINLEDTPQSEHFDLTIRGRASQEVPRFLDSLDPSS